MEKSRITCPSCGHPVELPMPADRSVVMYKCPHCHERIKAKEGKCCVFCSYGDKHCPGCTCFENQGSTLGTDGSQSPPSKPNNPSDSGENNK
jgi:hypothetical protein